MIAGFYITATVSYTEAHKEVTARRGKAADHTCVDCGGQADEWCFNHSTAEDRVCYMGGAAVGDRRAWFPYSTEPADYDPRCGPCHHSYDREDAPA